MKATGIGSLPGVDARAAIGRTLDLGDHAYLPELPGRGPGADMVGRTACLLPEFGKFGGPDARRARSWLRRDLDDLEELAQDCEGSVTVSLAGPATLWETLELPGQKSVAADHGARREVAAALEEAVGELVADFRRRLPRAAAWFKVDDPCASTDRAGELDDALDRVADAARRAGASRVILHSCGRFPFGLAAAGRMDAVSLDVGRLRAGDDEALAGLAGRGVGVWLGAVPTNEPDRVASVTEVADACWHLVEQWHADETFLAESVLVTPACGLATWTDDAAWLALATARDAADEITARIAG